MLEHQASEEQRDQQSIRELLVLAPLLITEMPLGPAVEQTDWNDPPGADQETRHFAPVSP